MNYLLTPEQLSFKTAVRRFIRSEAALPVGPFSLAPDDYQAVALMIEKGLANLTAGTAGQKGIRLSSVNSVIALEEVLRLVPEMRLPLSVSRLFDGLPSVLCRAASLLGEAQGRLAPYLNGGLRRGDEASPDSLWEPRFFLLAQLVSEIESVRLLVYRAAILQDLGDNNAEESARAASLADELVVRAVALSLDLEKGKDNET